MTEHLVFQDLSEPEVCQLAELLALCLRAGDVVALRGELGAGKTTLARGLIRGLLDDRAADVPSPTFALAQTYESARFPIAHFDLYRLEGPAELAELGLDEALSRGAVVIEWPERAGPMLPAIQLNVEIEEGTSCERRNLRLTAGNGWSERLVRLGQVRDFLVGALGSGAANPWCASYLQGDASARAYARISLAGSSKVLMNAPRMPDGPPIRNGLPYSRIAHLAEDVIPFVALATELARRGLATPAIFAEDMDQGLLLLEDLGDLTFGRALAAYSQAELWRSAVDVLLSLRQSGAPAPMPVASRGSYTLPVYDRGALAIETELLLDWYWPAHKGAAVASDVRRDFESLWGRHFDRLLEMPRAWVLRDFHSPNLMWRPERTGLARVGILDFQDAVQGPWAFDLVSLLQDARLDVPAGLEKELFDYYCERVRSFDPHFDAADFAYAYAALGAQRNTKIIGIFARLARRDGKPVYLQHIPRIWRYLERDLAHPSLSSLRGWYDRHFPPSVRTAVLAA